MNDVELEFHEELVNVLDKYSNKYGDANWLDEPLNKKEVDMLVGHLRNQLNLINGNISKEEYIERGGK